MLRRNGKRSKVRDSARYGIVAALGASGLGEVLRANDTSLHRNVTIKVLLDLFVKDPELLAPFQRGTSIRVAMEGNASG